MSTGRHIAAVVDLLPPDHPESLGRSHTLSIRESIGHERVVSESRATALGVILKRADPEALYQMDHLWAPFYCPTCSRRYCVRRWTVLPIYDEGFFDHSYGYCPEGFSSSAHIHTLGWVRRGWNVHPPTHIRRSRQGHGPSAAAAVPAARPIPATNCA